MHDKILGLTSEIVQSEIIINWFNGRRSAGTVDCNDNILSFLILLLLLLYYYINCIIEKRCCASRRPD